MEQRSDSGDPFRLHDINGFFPDHAQKFLKLCLDFRLLRFRLRMFHSLQLRYLLFNRIPL